MDNSDDNNNNVVQFKDTTNDNEIGEIKWISIDEYLKLGNQVFLGEKKENLSVVKQCSQWIKKYWDIIIDDKNNLTIEQWNESLLLTKYEMVHPFARKKKCLLYHKPAM